MMFSENVRMALTSIRSARTRSLFTMMGVIIGVVSVITMVSLGEGVKHQVLGQINHLGNDLITVRPGKLVNRGPNGEITSVNLLSAQQNTGAITDNDLKLIQANSEVESVAPLSIISALPKDGGKQFDDGVVIATTSNLQDVISHKIEFGSFFSSDASDNRTAVIGADVAEKLFVEAVPIGKAVQIRGQDFVVRGVFERFPRDPSSLGINYDNAIFIPKSEGETISDGKPPIFQVLVKPKSGADTSQITATLTDAIRSNHGGQTDFTILKQDEALSVTSSVLGIITTAIVAIAAVSLLVGGISIMNVMLVSVGERSKEIGIRKAIGATNSQIRTQFLIEAAVLSVWGAIIGVLLAGAINIVLLVTTNLQPVITWQPVVVATGVSIIVGMIFGVIPAVKASRRDPIESLRPS